MNSLAELRGEIDAIDAQLVGLIEQRFAVVDAVIAVKQKTGLAARLPKRVEDVVQMAVARARTGKVPPQTVEKLWRLLVSETIAYEESVLG